MLNEIKSFLSQKIESCNSHADKKEVLNNTFLWDDMLYGETEDSDKFISTQVIPHPQIKKPQKDQNTTVHVETEGSETTEISDESVREPVTVPTPAPTQNPASDNKLRAQNELKDILVNLGKDVDNSLPFDKKNKDKNQNIITRSELYLNIEKMSSSSNSEVAGIGKALTDLFRGLGIDLWEDDSNDPLSSFKKFLDSDSVYSNIVMDTIMAAIQGKELDPEPDGQKQLNYAGVQSGITIEDLMALDKNGDGSIVDELKALLNDKEFINTCEFKVQRQKNHENNDKLIDDIDRNNKDNTGDGKITEAEIKAAFGKNEIADLFKTSDGNVDKNLMLILGGIKQKDGSYTINVNALKNNIYLMDKDRDGNISKEEVKIFKNSDYYKQLTAIHG